MVKNLSAIQETWVQFLDQEDPLEKGMSTHPSVLAWRIPWKEEPGGLQSMGLQRVRHDWPTNTFTFNINMHTHNIIWSERNQTQVIIYCMTIYIKWKSTGTENRLVVARGWLGHGSRGIESKCLKGMGPLAKIKCSRGFCANDHTTLRVS